MHRKQFRTSAFLGAVIFAGRAYAQTGHIDADMFAGAKLNEKAYEFVVKLIHDGDLVCGGVAIDAKWVLTSAHCVQQNAAVPANRVVPAGAPVGSATDVHKFTPFCHPKFKPGGNTVDDLALLLVAGKALKPFGGKISAERALQADEAYFAIGWGRPTVGVLQRSQAMSVAPDADCVKLYQGQVMEANEICAGSKVSAPCRFDSGGPLFAAKKVLGIWSEREVMGVVSQADDDCDNVGPAIFAGFSPAELQWIKDVMAGKSSVRTASSKACLQ